MFARPKHFWNHFFDYFCNYHDVRGLGKIDHLGYRKRITSIYKRDGGYAFYFQSQSKDAKENLRGGILRDRKNWTCYWLFLQLGNLRAQDKILKQWVDDNVEKIGWTNHGTMITMSECGKICYWWYWWWSMSISKFFGFFSQIVLGDHGLLVPVLFFKLTLSKCKKIIEFQNYFPISAKAMPWSLWKWLGSQRIFEGIKFLNPIGYSPGQAHVTNIDPKCSVFLLGLKKWKQDPIFFPSVPGVSMRMYTEINPGSTCIEGKHFWESETKYKKTHVTKHHSERTPKSMYDCVGWSWSFGSPSFFFKLTLSKCSKDHRISEIFSHQCQGHALISVKVTGLPTHFWRNKIPKPNWL